MPDPVFDLEGYARRIGYDGDGRPTLATLAAIIGRHAQAIPFENIDVLAKRVPGLELEPLQRKLVHSRRGGYCFEQNNLLLAALRALDFTVRPLEARVRAGVPAEVATARTHMALCVTLDGDDWLADAGFGALAPVAPLRLGAPEPQPTPTGAYRFVDAEGDLMLQARTHAGWNDCYRIGPDRPQAIDFEMGNLFVATWAKSMLRQNLLVARSVPQGRLRLFNHELELRANDVDPPVTRTLATRAEFSDVLAEEFGLEIAPADLDALMALLDAKLAA